jgi:hypothetical protein
MTELCPACGARPQEDGRTGFCRPCSARRILDEYLARGAKEATRRHRRWSERSRAALEEALLGIERLRDTERQRRHRLLEATRPRRPWSGPMDPLEIAYSGLRNLALVRSAVHSNVRARAALEEASEAMRRLAWGPGEEGAR